MRWVDVFVKPFVLVLFPFNTKGKHQSNRLWGYLPWYFQVMSEKQRSFVGPRYVLLNMLLTRCVSGCFLEGCLFLFLGSSVQRCGNIFLDIFKQCQRTWAKELHPSLRLNTLWNFDRSLNVRQVPSAQTIKKEWTAETSEAKHDECNAKKTFKHNATEHWIRRSKVQTGASCPDSISQFKQQRQQCRTKRWLRVQKSSVLWNI